MTAQHFVSHDAKGYQVSRLVNGLYRLPVGPHFPTPRAAMAYADALDVARDVSPLPATRSGPEPVEVSVSPRQQVAPVTAQGRSGSPVGLIPQSDRA